MRAVRRIVAAVVMLGAMSVPQACTMSALEDETSTPGCADRVLDLQRPPSRSDLHMGEGEGATGWSCDDGFEARLEMPAAVTTTMASRQVSVDSSLATDPSTGRPTTVDIRSTSLGVEAAAELAARVGADLGIDVGELDSWSIEAEKSETSGDVTTSVMQTRVGYVLAQLQVVHQGVSGTNYVHLILSWGR